MLKVLTEMVKEQVEEGKYAPKPQKHGLDEVEFVPQGGKVLIERGQTKPWKAKVVLNGR